MSTAFSTPIVHTGLPLASVSVGELVATPDDVQLRFIKQLESAASWPEAIRGAGRLLHELVEGTWSCFHCPRQSDRQLGSPVWLGELASQPAALSAEAAYVAQAACISGKLQSLRSTAASGLSLVAIAICIPGALPEVIGLVLRGDDSRLSRVRALLALAAAHLSLWHAMQPGPTDAGDMLSRRLLKQLQALGNAGANPSQIATRVADEAAAVLGNSRVAIGLRRSDDTCRFLALSGAEALDRNTDLFGAIESALGIALAHDEPLLWRMGDSTTASGMSELQRVARLTNSTAVAAVKLNEGNVEARGALLVYGPVAALTDSTFLPRLTLAAALLAAPVTLLDRAAQFRPSDLVPGWATNTNRRWRWIALGVIAAIGLIALIPIPDSVGCKCLVEPHTRRFVAAPFAGILEKTLVVPGDVVKQDQILASLDEKPLKLELALRQAEYEEKRKRHGAALAGLKAAEAQVSEAELAQINSKLRDLERRLNQLTIRSPMNGVVVRGDLKRSEGIPLEQGQSLFEIAPLEPMIAELSIPEDEYRLVQDAMIVTIRLDAFPGRSWSGEITRIHPRAELRDEQSVFIAEVSLTNAAAEMRPGMHGYAKVSTHWQSLGWTWLRRPVTRFIHWLGW